MVPAQPPRAVGNEHPMTRTIFAEKNTKLKLVVALTLLAGCAAEVDVAADIEAERVAVSTAALMAGPVANIPGMAVADLLKKAAISIPTPAQTARAQAVQAHLAEHFARYRFLDTSVSAAGQTFDWVDPVDLDPKFNERMANKPPTSQLVPGGNSFNEESVTPLTLPEKIDPIFRRSDGLVPVLRPNLTNFINGASGAANLTEFLANLKKAGPNTAAASTFRLYTGWQSQVNSVSNSALNTGAEAWINTWKTAGVPSGAFSLVQTSLGSAESIGGKRTETVEFGLQTDPDRYGDNLVHYFTYFNTDGYASQGNYIGGYNQDQLGFVPYPGAFPPGTQVGGNFSTVGGTQYERRLSVQLYNGAWWVQDFVSPTSFTWLGYYPVGTTSPNINFQYIKNSASIATWYSEVYDPTPSTWTKADVAAGKFASAGWGSVGWIRNPINYRTSGNLWFPLTGNGGAGSNDPLCYTNTAVKTIAGDSTMTRYWYYGGPGYTTGATGTCK